MKNNLADKINAAKKECELNDKASYSKKIRTLAHEYMTENNVDTLETTVRKHNISFHKGNSDTPESITMTVDGKNYSGSNMDDKSESNIDDKICALDHIGPEYKKERDKAQRNSRIRDNAKAMGRIVKVDLTRKIINELAKMTAEGNSLLTSLPRLAGRTISKAMQSR